jgi:hypothetical protein
MKRALQTVLWSVASAASPTSVKVLRRPMAATVSMLCRLSSRSAITYARSGPGCLLSHMRCSMLGDMHLYAQPVVSQRPS